jgi:hypothetical protein
MLHYLEHIEMNLILAGSREEHEKIASRFEPLFPPLGFRAAKEHGACTFDYVQDVFGRQEPFALLEREREDG